MYRPEYSGYASGGPFGHGRRFDDVSDVNSITSSWEEDPEAPVDIKTQLQHLQGMIFKKERESSEVEQRYKHGFKELQETLDFAEAERKRLENEVSRLNTTLSSIPDQSAPPPVDLDKSEITMQIRSQLQEEFDRSREYDHMQWKSEAERQKKLDESAIEDSRARESRLQKMMQEEIDRNNEREEILKKQLDEERQLADERARKREDTLRKQLREDEQRSEDRVNEMRELVDAERRKVNTVAKQRDDEIDGLKRQLSVLKNELFSAKEDMDKEKRLLEDKLNAELREREELLRIQQAEVLEREREAFRGREDAMNVELLRRDEQAARREDELRDQIESARQQVQEVRDQWNESERDKLQKQSQVETALRNEIAENKREALEREAALRQQLDDAHHTITRAKSSGNLTQQEYDAATQRSEELRKEWDKMRQSLEEALYAERQRLLSERKEWETELNAERDRMTKMMELELSRQKQELEDAHKASLDMMRNQLDEARLQVAPSPPAIRRQGSVPPRSLSRPQPTPPSNESPVRRPHAPPPTPLAQDDDITRTRALARELEMTKQQRNNYKQRTEDLEDELEALKKREKERIAAEIDEANRKIQDLRGKRGSLEDAKSDVERKLREANMLLNEQHLQSKRVERLAAQECDDLRTKYQTELKRAQEKQFELEDQVLGLKEAVREAEDKARRMEKELEMERATAAGQMKTSEVQLRAQITELHSEVNTLRADLAKRSEELATKSVDIASTQGELIAKTADMLQLQGQLANAEDKIDALCKNLAERDALVKAQTELSEVESKRQAETLKLFENECNQHQTQLENLQNLLHKRQEELDCATIEASAVRKDVEVFKAENKRLREELGSKAEFFRKELEALRDESHSLERRAYSAEREAQVQKEHADGLQSALKDFNHKETEKQAVASNALAEAADQELERLRQQLSTKTDQLLMKDRKEEALRNKLTSLIDEIAPDPDLCSEPVAGAIDKVCKWKEWIAKKLAEEEDRDHLLKEKDTQLGFAVSKLEELKQAKHTANVLRRTNSTLKKKIAKLRCKRGAGSAASSTVEVTPNTTPSQLCLTPAPVALQTHSASSIQPASAATPVAPLPRRQSEPPAPLTGTRRASPSRARIPLPTKSVTAPPTDPRRVSPPRRRLSPPRKTDVSPLPPVHMEIQSPSPVVPRSEGVVQTGPSLEQIEKMLESMECLINQPMPGSQLRTVSPTREAKQMSPLPQRRQQLVQSPRQQLVQSPKSLSPRDEAQVRSLLEAHEASRMRREQKAEDMRRVLTGLQGEVAEMQRKEAELVDHRDKTVRTIDEQHDSLTVNAGYWREQLMRYEMQGIEVEASKCRVRVVQTEEDIMSLVRQKPDMLIKADQAQAHITQELIRLTEQKTVIESELLQLTQECNELRTQEATLTNAILPPASFLPNPLPAPRIL